MSLEHAELRKLQAEQLVAQEQRVWDLKDIPQPPQDLIEALARSQEWGFTFEPHFLPEREYKQNSRWPGKGIRPEPWFWKQVGRHIGEDAAKLPGAWVLIEGIQKPNYDDGRQLYPNDALGSVLETLRAEGRISVPHYYRHVPVTSRFAVSHDEIRTHVVPEVAQILGVDPAQLRTPREIEFNLIGNLHYPEGETNTWEWLNDDFRDGNRLNGGGDSAHGGLASVHWGVADRRHGYLGFRLMAVFPTNA